MTPHQLPPVGEREAARLQLELRLVRLEHRADAVQVAWVAHLERRDPAVAVNSWWRSELRRFAREKHLGSN